jgi:hypothetical protein
MHLEAGFSPTGMGIAVARKNTAIDANHPIGTGPQATEGIRAQSALFSVSEAIKQDIDVRGF